MELVHGVTRSSLVFDTPYGMASGGEKFAEKPHLANHALLGDDMPYH